jgi:hypothetical protein
MYDPFNIMLSYDLNLLGVVSLFVCYWPLPMTIDAISATIVAGGQARFNKHRGQHKLINFHFNLLNLLNRFNVGVGKNMRKAGCPYSGMVSSNPHRWRGKWPHHHGDAVCQVVTCRM